MPLDYVIQGMFCLCLLIDLVRVSAISRRKIDMPIEKVVSALNSLDLKQFSLENVEILQRMLPTEQEVRAGWWCSLSEQRHLFYVGNVFY